MPCLELCIIHCWARRSLRVDLFDLPSRVRRCSLFATHLDHIVDCTFSPFHDRYSLTYAHRAFDCHVPHPAPPVYQPLQPPRPNSPASATAYACNHIHSTISFLAFSPTLVLHQSSPKRRRCYGRHVPMITLPHGILHLEAFKTYDGYQVQVAIPSLEI